MSIQEAVMFIARILQVWSQQAAEIFMVKKKEKALTKKEKVGMLADKLNEAIDSCKLEPTEELDIFAESVALLIAYWGKISDWSPIEKASYVSYVTITIMEKGLDTEIESFEEHRKKMKPQIGN